MICTGQRPRRPRYLVVAVAGELVVSAWEPTCPRSTPRPTVRSMAREVLAARPLTQPALARLPIDSPKRQEILAAHAHALGRHLSGYLDPESGLFVLSAWFLAERGYCCERGCRHCPYIEDEPRDAC